MMRKSVFIILTLVLTVYLFGCGKKEAVMEESQEQMSMDTVVTEVKTTPESKAQAAPIAPTMETKASDKAELLPPSGPYKPTVLEIQAALANAGLYTGKVDGKSGPMTKKAIEDFQKANGLQVDGKVGLKTWSVLSTHLNPPVESKLKKR